MARKIGAGRRYRWRWCGTIRAVRTTVVAVTAAIREVIAAVIAIATSVAGIVAVICCPALCLGGSHGEQSRPGGEDASN